METEMTNLKKLALASLAAALLPTVSLADSDVITLPTAAPIDESKTKSCAEAMQDAYFLRDMKRTDGDTDPEVGPVPECAAEGTKS
jgi:hypothetical protein